MKKKKPTANPFYSGSGFRVLGIGKQEAIKYFFGGNATIAIIVITLIIGFLIIIVFIYYLIIFKIFNLKNSTGFNVRYTVL